MAILHPSRKLTAIMPRYVSRFSCTGSACEDSCCSGWQISLDKKTFNAYRQTGSQELKRSMEQNIQRDPSSSEESTYGWIKLEPETGKCPLVSDGLCGVQKQLGESYLSHTCFSYPRLSRRVSGQYEQSLQLSCPEAARQALLAEDAFEFVEGTVTLRANVAETTVTAQGYTLEMVNEIRIFCLNLVRTRDLPLWQRLALLGVFCERLTTLFAAGEHAGAFHLMESLAAVVEQRQMSSLLGDLEPDLPAQALVFSVVWGGKPLISESTSRNDIIVAVAEGLGFNAQGEVSNERLIDSYARGVQRLPEALAAAPYLLENYVANEIFAYMFPFNVSDPYEAYLQLVSRFGVVRMMLVALCNTQGALPDPIRLAKAAQTHARRFHHDRDWSKRVNSALLHSGRGALEKIFPLLP